MENRWESILVALGLICLFYFIRRYFLQKTPPCISGSVHATPTKIRGKQTKAHVRKKIKVSIKNTSQTQKHAASLIMHPHSLECAEKEFSKNALRFRGSYESLYMTCYGKVTSVFREQVLRQWEEGIQASKAQYLLLVWTTIIQKHCGRNYYYNRVSREYLEVQVVSDILQDWLKQMFKWGLLREVHGQLHLKEFDGEPISNPGTEKLCWSLDGVVLEEEEKRVIVLGQ